MCFVDTPNSQIELIEPLGRFADFTFLERIPTGGQHHLCFEVPDIEAAQAFFEGKGARILGPTRIGRMARSSSSFIRRTWAGC